MGLPTSQFRPILESQSRSALSGATPAAKWRTWSRDRTTHTNQVERLTSPIAARNPAPVSSASAAALNGTRAVFHRPHPQKETDKGAVKSLRRFFSEAQVTP